MSKRTNTLRPWNCSSGTSTGWKPVDCVAGCDGSQTRSSCEPAAVLTACSTLTGCQSSAVAGLPSSIATSTRPVSSPSFWNSDQYCSVVAPFSGISIDSLDARIESPWTTPPSGGGRSLGDVPVQYDVLPPWAWLPRNFCVGVSLRCHGWIFGSSGLLGVHLTSGSCSASSVNVVRKSSVSSIAKPLKPARLVSKVHFSGNVPPSFLGSSLSSTGGVKLELTTVTGTDIVSLWPLTLLTSVSVVSYLPTSA